MKKSTFDIPEDNKIVELKGETKDIRKDKDKEYIYYTDAETITHELDIEYKNIVFNFEGQDNIVKELNDETLEFKKNLMYDEGNEEATYNHLTNAKYKIYTVYTYDNYITTLRINQYF